VGLIIGIAGIGLGVLLAGPTSLAHHSFAVEYDANKPIEGTGVISKVEWMNPHARIYVDVTGAGGSVTTWNLELGSPNSLRRRGWTKNDLNVGDRISFKAYGGRTTTTRSVALSITLANGRTLTISGGSDEPN
jgi:hypothetical protein